MLQKLELQQLQALSLEDVKSYKKKAVERKAELEAAKAKGGKAWTSDLQEELDEVVLFLVDVDDIIEENHRHQKHRLRVIILLSRVLRRWCTCQLCVVVGLIQ